MGGEERWRDLLGGVGGEEGLWEQGLVQGGAGTPG